MLLIALVVATRSARLNEASLPTFRSLIAKITGSWRTGLEFRKCIRFTSKANASLGRVAALRRPDAAARRPYQHERHFAARGERRYSGHNEG